MNIKYDKETNILYIRSSDLRINESDEEKQGAILDYAEDSSLIGIEVLNASKSNLSPAKVAYEFA